MRKYKKEALERFNLEDKYQVFFLKSNKDYICNKCGGKIAKGEVRFQQKSIYSYLVDLFDAYHLDCVSRDEIIEMLESNDWEYIEENLI